MRIQGKRLKVKKLKLMVTRLRLFELETKKPKKLLKSNANLVENIELLMS